MRNGISTSAGSEITEARDALADVAAVIGNDERVRTQEVLHRLAELADVYRAWTFADLAATLGPYGAGPYKSHGVQTIARARVVEALADRGDDAA
jgi:S-DNA-T family DNA segregation ATPase FtsK/SpoIIIE